MPALQVATLGHPKKETCQFNMTDMPSTTDSIHITRLQFKDEGENQEGLPIGKLTDQHANPVFPDERWVTKREALRIAADLGVELFEY